MTTDGGNNWSDTCLSAEPLYDSRQVSNYRIVAVGGDPEYGAVIFQSLDAGISWQINYLGIGGGGTRISGRTAAEFWIPCTISGKFAVSTDSAKTWFAVNAPESCYVYDTRFNSPYNGWCIGFKDANLRRGMILKYNTDIIGIEPKSENIPLESVLYQNYPNPFNSTTVLKYYLAKVTDVMITIYNAAGREIFSIKKTGLNQGFYSFSFDAGDFASGVYFIRLTTGDTFQYRKMVLIK
jgi:hypothetical protein